MAPLSILSPIDVLRKGLGYVGIGLEEQDRLSLQGKADEFQSHYGSSPLVVADIWFDLCHTTIAEACLEEKKKSEGGFKRFMIAMFFLWTS